MPRRRCARDSLSSLSFSPCVSWRLSLARPLVSPGRSSLGRSSNTSGPLTSPRLISPRIISPHLASFLSGHDCFTHTLCLCISARRSSSHITGKRTIGVQYKFDRVGGDGATLQKLPPNIGLRFSSKISIVFQKVRMG